MFKKYIVSGFFILFVTVSFLTIDERNAASNIQGGYHDLTFTGSGGFASYMVEEVCVFCHAPHNTNTSQTYTTNPTTGANDGNLHGKYLWNRRLPIASNFLPYTSSTLKSNTSAGPGALSLLCLSCHDGVGAMNVLLNYPNNTPITGVVGVGVADQFGDIPDPAIVALNIGEANCDGSDNCTGGVDLRNDHPIGFDYISAQTADPTGLKVITNGALLLRMSITGNRVECNTCHDPHITNNPSLKNKFLVVTNKGSQLCLECHNK